MLKHFQRWRFPTVSMRDVTPSTGDEKCIYHLTPLAQRTVGDLALIIDCLCWRGSCDGWLVALSKWIVITWFNNFYFSTIIRSVFNCVHFCGLSTNLCKTYDVCSHYLNFASNGCFWSNQVSEDLRYRSVCTIQNGPYIPSLHGCSALLALIGRCSVMSGFVPPKSNSASTLLLYGGCVFLRNHFVTCRSLICLLKFKQTAPDLVWNKLCCLENSSMLTC